MILLVGGERDGSGKSCLAQNLAVQIRQSLNGDVLMVDCDPQGSTSDWAQTRNTAPQLSAIHCIQLAGKIRHDLLGLEDRFAYVIVDGGGHDKLALQAAMSVASLVAIPLRPKPGDLDSLHRLGDMLGICSMVNPRMVSAVILAQCPTAATQYKHIVSAKARVRACGLPVLDSVSFSRRIYDASEGRGAAVVETAPKSKAAAEIRAITHELLDLTARKTTEH
ncbi:chromosome partitioning protein ParA [Shewanella sp. AS16]|uniref:nucleotide-binding protein n=1 Tax=Shewanella sp. AS16 TaxID=2907625 RepID=UPI001F26DBC4|nr:chromosome partitioning protein ParA [Shewanella sp. AS16]MCE9684936.1 chromosome partitioning protein ParA [Shewanella sp. AS16]